MKILISGYTGLGNFILKTPALMKIKELYPDSTIDILVGNPFGVESILQSGEIIDSIITLDERSSWIKKLIFFYSLRKKKYDLVFLPFDATRKFILVGSYIANIKKRLLHFFPNKRMQNILLFTLPKTHLVPILQGRHEIDLNLDLVEAYYNRPMERNYNTYVSYKENSNFCEKWGIISPFIVLQVGAANGSATTKRWPLYRFKELIKQFKQYFPQYQVVIVGDKGDRSQIKESLNELGVINTAGKTTLEDVKNIILKSELVISNDSGIMHLSCALKKNLIALYGPTDYTRTRPLGTNVHLLFSKNKYLAALYNFAPSEATLTIDGDDCMKDLSTREVMSKVRELLERV